MSAPLATRVIPAFTSVGEHEWACLDHADNPFLTHAFLGGLESTGSIGPATGWQPHHVGVYAGDELQAFAPCYVKSHSHGEFVFDWAWADAYHRHGLRYYPKLLSGIPYSPVTGPRLLVRRDAAEPDSLRRRLVEAIVAECESGGHSSWHCNFVRDTDRAALDASALLRRRDWQFHWNNPGYRDFDDFLSALRSRKRKNIRRERRQVAAAGIEFACRTGKTLSNDELDFVYRCYVGTFHAYGNHPALKPEFFRHLAEALDERFIVILALRDGEPLAMALFLRGGERLYGRYWGCSEDVPGLHFEVAYYQGIEYCIRENLQVFESGAQGEHKLSRGFVPVQTRSYHHVCEAAFREAIREALEREDAWLDRYREQLAEQDPYRRDTA